MWGFQNNAREYLQKLADEVLKLDTVALQTWSDWMYETWVEDKTVFVIGNGGAATTAAHLSEDFGTEPFRGSPEAMQLRRLKVLSLADNPGWITAVGNDLQFDLVFIEQLKCLARAGDLLIALSGSGESKNLVEAVRWANDNGLRTFSLTGFGGGRLKTSSHASLHIPVFEMGVVQSLHLAAMHWVLDDFNARVNHLGRHAAT